MGAVFAGLRQALIVVVAALWALKALWTSAGISRPRPVDARATVFARSCYGAFVNVLSAGFTSPTTLTNALKMPERDVIVARRITALTTVEARSHFTLIDVFAFNVVQY